MIFTPIGMLTDTINEASKLPDVAMSCCFNSTLKSPQPEPNPAPVLKSSN
jgi:hypothetical protein